MKRFHCDLCFIGRTIKNQLSDLNSHVGECQARCNDLKDKFDHRVRLDTNKEVKQIEYSLKVIKDIQLGINVPGLSCLLVLNALCSLADRVHQWLSAPDSSRNYNEAQEKHQDGTCQWFISGPQFTEWKANAGHLLWVYGIRKCSTRCNISMVVT